MTATTVDDGHDTRGCGTWPGECTWTMTVTQPPVGPVRVRRAVHCCQWDGGHRGPCTCRRCGASTTRGLPDEDYREPPYHFGEMEHR